MKIKIYFTRICAELNAYYAHLYDLTRDELRYTPFGVDPREIHGEDLRHALTGSQRRFLWRDLPRAEGEASQAVWGRLAQVLRSTGRDAQEAKV